MSGPVVFVSDLGLRDEFVGVCHLVVARIAPDVRVVDLSHGVPPHDIQAGAMMLTNGMAHAGPYAVALAIVDPGVGTARRAIAVKTADGPRLVGPDNGLLSLAWKALGGVTMAVEIDPAAVGSRTVSAVFHGRDVFAPAAAHLAAGMPLENLGRAADPASLTTLELEDAESEPGRIHGSVVDVDRFGNIRLSARPADLERAGFRVGTMVEVATTATSIRARRIVAYSDVRPGEYGMLVDAWDWVSVIRYEASAAAGMGVTRGDPVWIALAGSGSSRGPRPAASIRVVPPRQEIRRAGDESCRGGRDPTRGTGPFRRFRAERSAVLPRAAGSRPEVDEGSPREAAWGRRGRRPLSRGPGLSPGRS